MHNFKNLEIWKKAVTLSLDIYKLTNDFPDKEKFGLTSQLNRAGVSVASNIAECAGRKGNNEFVQFCFIAIGSLCEIETQLRIAKNLNFLD